MSATDKTKNKSDELVGKIKEKTGEVTGDDDLRASGKADQTKALPVSGRPGPPRRPPVGKRRTA